jgi:hypothetical protein
MLPRGRETSFRVMLGGSWIEADHFEKCGAGMRVHDCWHVLCFERVSHRPANHGTRAIGLTEHHQDKR